MSREREELQDIADAILRHRLSPKISDAEFLRNIAHGIGQALFEGDENE